MRGFKFHPSLQAFHPDDRMCYPLYEAIEAAGAVAVFHSGQTGIGAGVRGGGGIRLKYANPLALDDVAADFPDLKIVIAHPSFPWQDEALAVATHKPLVHIDLSGWPPKYFPPRLVRYANTLLSDKVLFGSDYPVITPDRWLADFETLDIRPEVRPKILNQTVLPTFCKGGTAILVSTFDPDGTLELIERYRITFLFGVPAMFLAIARTPRWAEVDLSSVRSAICGGAPVPEPLLATYRQRGVILQRGNGLTGSAPAPPSCGPGTARPRPAPPVPRRSSPMSGWPARTADRCHRTSPERC